MLTFTFAKFKKYGILPPALLTRGSMPNSVEKDIEFQVLLESYLRNHPGSERELADEFRTAVGTITRWANGHSRPARRAQEVILESLKSKIYRELQDVCSGLTDDFRVKLATSFEVVVSTVQRWANGTARPHPRLAQMIIKYVKNNKSE